jgi:twitching motility protein PilT
MDATEAAAQGPRALLHRLLASMASWGASDLFLAQSRPPAVRVAGTVVPIDVPPLSHTMLQGMVEEIAPPNRLKEFERTGDLDAGYSLPDGSRFRFNLARQRGTLHLVARALPQSSLEFDRLGLPSLCRRAATLQRGLFLVTGASGSGKSTTLAAIVHHINQNRRCHVVTIEDPIEFIHHDQRARITQREVGQDTESFHAALRSVLRQSPDVIVLGEMRDLETMRVAIQAALTGHLVLATLHTMDATQTVQRILTYFPEEARRQAAHDLATCLQGVMSQRLVPTADGKSRVLAWESLAMTPPARRFIEDLEVEELYDLMRASNDEDMQTYTQTLLQHYRAGSITHDAARAHATNPDEFSLLAQGMSNTGTGKVGIPELANTGLNMKSLLEVVSHHGASDLHVTVGRPPILRVDGSLRALDVPPLSLADMRVLLFSVMSSSQRTHYEIQREIDFALALDDGSRFRVNAYFQRNQMAASLRSIASVIPDPVALGLPPAVIALADRPQGLLLVVGPTGSGKSTTLACLLDRINTYRSCRIITVEDPIEFVHQGKLATVDQREVDADTRSFAAALKYVLRQDPDVILVGEMRDLETVSAALTAAETGHLVLATLHTNDAIQAIDRVIDVFPAHQQSQVRSVLSAALLGVVSQRLLPRVGGGRVGVFEVMVANPALRALIRDNKMHQAQSIMEASTADGMVTMDRALKDLLAARRISQEDAMRYTRNPRTLMG